MSTVQLINTFNKDKTMTNEKSKGYMNIISKNCYSLLNIINDIIDSSKIETHLSGGDDALAAAPGVVRNSCAGGGGSRFGGATPASGGASHRAAFRLTRPGAWRSGRGRLARFWPVRSVFQKRPFSAHWGAQPRPQPDADHTLVIIQ